MDLWVIVMKEYSTLHRDPELDPSSDEVWSYTQEPNFLEGILTPLH